MKENALRDKTVIITGAAGGIGAETAALLDRHGANLVLADINVPGLKKTAKALSRPALAIQCDITRKDDIKKLIAQARKQFGTIDILVNNAGIIIPSLFENTGYRDIEKQVSINLMGPIFFTREIVPEFIKNGSGHIVTISSMAGIVPETYSSIYTATKFALRGFSLTLALELKRHNIGVSVIFPDSTDTPMLRFEAAHGGSPLTFLSTPQKPADIAQAVLRAITHKKLEQYVPYSSGFFSKLLMCVPRAVIALWPVLEKSAEKKKAAYQQHHNITETREN